MICFVTFYSHFDAIRMRRRLEGLGIGAVLMPVPRDLSSSCGTCLRFETDLPLPDFLSEGTEKVVEAEDGGYRVIYSSEEAP